MLKNQFSFLRSIEKNQMGYNYNQKMAILRLLLDIINIDGRIDEREVLYFEKVKKELCLTSADHFKVNNFSTLQSLSILKDMSLEQKKNYATFMRKMILIDEIIEPSERLAYETICAFCEIPTIELDIESKQ